MKRLIALILALVMMFALTSCAGKGQTSEDVSYDIPEESRFRMMQCSIL